MGDKNKEKDIATIGSLLHNIRTTGTKKDESTKALIGMLLKKPPETLQLTHEECLLFYDAILSCYVDHEEDLKMLLAVSGRLDGYKSIKTAVKRRGKFHGISENTKKYSDDLDVYRKQEDDLLNSIAKKLYEDWNADKIPELVKERMLGSNKSDIKDNNDRSQTKNGEYENFNQTKNGDVFIDNRRQSNTFVQIINLILNNRETTQEQNVNQVSHNVEIKVSQKKFYKKRFALGMLLVVLVCGGYFAIKKFIIKTSTPVKELFVSTNEIVLEPGEYYYLSTEVGVIPKEAVHESLNYISSDTDVVTVSKDGVVLAQGNWQGKESRTAKITIQAESGATAHKAITVQKLTADATQVTTDVENFKPTYTLNITVRLAGTKGNGSWSDQLYARLGDELEYQIIYHNVSDENQYNVMIRNSLPENLNYIEGSTQLWNASMDGYTDKDDTLMTTGVNIGSYGPGANAYIRFRAKIVDESLAYGSNTMVDWIKGTASHVVLQDFAAVTIHKEESGE